MCYQDSCLGNINGGGGGALKNIVMTCRGNMPFYLVDINQMPCSAIFPGFLVISCKDLCIRSGSKNNFKQLYVNSFTS